MFSLSLGKRRQIISQRELLFRMDLSGVGYNAICPSTRVAFSWLIFRISYRLDEAIPDSSNDNKKRESQIHSEPLREVAPKDVNQGGKGELEESCKAFVELLLEKRSKALRNRLKLLEQEELEAEAEELVHEKAIQTLLRKVCSSLRTSC